MISVIIPVYNAAKTLRRAIDSILNQTYTDYEIILIDDGSKDESALICNEYADNDSRIHYFYQDNQGPDMARKAGTVKAKGEYLMYLDSDDYIKPETLQKMLDSLLENDADFVCCNLTRFNESKEWPLIGSSKELTILNGQNELYKAFFVDRSLPGGYPAKLIKTKLIKDYPFVKDSVIGEDVTAILYVISHSSKVCLLPNPYYMYYWNLSSISHSGYTKRHEVSLKNYIDVKEHLLESDINLEKKYIVGFFAEYEMAVATAMARAKVYDKPCALILKNDLSKTNKDIKACEITPLHMKICISLYLINPKLFIKMYRVLYLLTGR